MCLSTLPMRRASGRLLEGRPAVRQGEGHRERGAPVALQRNGALELLGEHADQLEA
jgi:hypothetical protein